MSFCHLRASLFFLFLSVNIFAQTGIGTTTPNASAKLDVYATNKGFLPPRIALLSTTDVATIASPANGLIIYNTATAGTSPNNVLPGYYYWDGTKWNGLVDQGALNSFSGYIPNYAQSNASSVTKSAVGDIIVSQSITTSGRPIQVIATGDANPQADGAWVQLQLYRDGTAIGKKVQAESSLSNENVPYCLNYIDNPTAGTYTYTVKITSTSGSNFQFGEADGNQITLLELGAWSAGTMPVSKGGTGNSSYTAGSVMFSDGTNITQNNSKLFWNNTNYRLGVGTSAPNASAIVDISSTTQGLLPPRMTATQRSAITSPATGLVVYQTDANIGEYIYNGTSWQNSSSTNFGDIKIGIQSSDHNGWIKLNGRLKSSLTSTQQTQATALGIGTNLPDASNAYPVQNGSTLGTISGANTKTIVQSNLPNATLSGTTSTDGAHTHSISFSSTAITQIWTLTSTTGGTAGYNLSPNETTSSSGSHNHTFTTSSINGNVTQTALDITPKSISVNMFIYLGY